MTGTKQRSALVIACRAWRSPSLLILIISGLTVLPVTAHTLHAQEISQWIEIHGTAELQIIAADSDSDGIFDWREEMLGTKSDSADSDDDGFNDLFEDGFRAFGFDPLVFDQDSDADGLTDAFEKEWGTSIDLQDTDSDRYSDFDEVLNHRFGYDPSRPTSDRDFDGLADTLERYLGSSPVDPDSNGDGINDFEAQYEGIHPLEEFEDHFGEIIGSSYSSRMQKAIHRMRAGAPFPAELAVELPYPAITRRLYGSDVRGIGKADQISAVNPQPISPSAAILQSGVASNPDIFYVTALYPTYNQIVNQIKNIAMAFDGSPRPNIVRLFYWSEPTEGHRRIFALKISDNPEVNENESEMLFMGLHHGRELITASYTMEFIRALTSGYANGDQAVVSRVNASELWVIPIVNPDGYAMAQSEFAQGANVNWRKNIRKVFEQSTSGQIQTEQDKGVDPNRNYDFTHIRTLSVAQRLALDARTCEANGLTGISDPNLLPCEGFVVGDSTYAGAGGFTDVEARSVRMLADNQFFSGDEIDSLRCSLSWHTGAPGDIISPINHDSYVSVSPQDRIRLDKLGNAYAAATGFFYWGDTWWQVSLHYQAFGTSDDWLYTHNGILPLTIEAYGSTTGPDFFPETAAVKNANVDKNLAGAVAFMTTCAPLRIRFP